MRHFCLLAAQLMHSYMYVVVPVHAYSDYLVSVCSSSRQKLRVYHLQKTVEKEPDLKLFGPDRWETAKNAAAWRLQNDVYRMSSERQSSQKASIITQIVLVNSVLSKHNLPMTTSFLSHPGK